ncbi:MAG TPA: choice-of-anchor D domain-containing protein, partial [Ktedonobacteraceae bacterium]|nr:choice-of-anchor D domain-containing protein [Ktedonobacteraceae bacterium]
QTITLQNTGGLPLNWASTVDASSWLSVTPASGSLERGAQVTVTVNVNGSVLTQGVYHGAITFKNGDFTPQVGVAVTVNPAPTTAINVQNTTLSFTTYKGNNPTPKTFTFTNTGNAPLNWTASEDGNGASFAPVNRTSGQVAPGKSVVLTVSPNVLGYGAGILSTVITIADSDPGTKVSSQKLSVTITVLDQAAITLSTNTLSFANSSTTPDTSKLLSITNSGSATLNWSVALKETTAANITWLSVDLPSATLSPGARSVVNVHYDSSQLSSGTYTATLTINDSDPGTPVSSQVVQITLIVQ